MTGGGFDDSFAALTGHPPFPWQRTLYIRMMAGTLPASCDIPTGLGKTSVIAVWLLARAAGAAVPRRLVYVVNRRTVVDQTTAEVERLRDNLAAARISEPLAISTLRGQMADNRAWSEDPARSAVICGTVDMIGSRLLFSGYRTGFKGKPLHAGFLGQDALLVHDEAHLEPAFQALVEAIVMEQARAGDPWPLRVMALTATVRDQSGSELDEGQVLRLGAEDRADPEVGRRIRATKKLSLHPVGDDRQVVDHIIAQVLTYRMTGAAVLVFVRTVDDATRIAERLDKEGMANQQLTGTMRGYERDKLVSLDPVFRRFLPSTDGLPPAAGNVVLVSTSAGEVGVNLSADHLVCDLSTFDAMAQRFGRVNRFGLRNDSEAHVFHSPFKSSEDDPVEARRIKTLAVLEQLGGDASPMALSLLDAGERSAAFAPPPEILPATDVLFDAWAMTTIRDELPGRPPVSAYLHGVSEYEPPTAQVAWRDEVDLLTDDLRSEYLPQDLLEDYPLKSHELLTDRVQRILKTLTSLVEVHEEAKASPAWVVREGGNVHVTTLGVITDDDPRRAAQALASCILLLSPRDLRPVRGLLRVDGWRRASGAALDQDDEGRGVGSARRADVADEWQSEGGLRHRVRIFDGETAPGGMRLIRTITLGDGDDVQDGPGEVATPPAPRRWSWYELPHGADDEGSRSAARPVLLDVHSGDVERIARGIVVRLPLAPGLRRAVVLAAKHHDHGKNRRVWQRSIGNNDKARLFAKSGWPMRPLNLTSYRHELGSVLDAEKDLLHELEPDERDLALHLIAAHHGRARPHFPEDELFDPEARGIDVRAEGLRIAQRFARLQRRFGRWGLAYLESLVRAADYAASAEPSQYEQVE